MSELKVKLNKKYYGLKGALNLLDEEFKEFLANPKDYKEFFKIWNKFFYNLLRGTHSYFLGKSTKYAYPDGLPPNERLIEKQDLEKQLRDIQRQIDSKEKEHFFIKNHVFVVLSNDNIIVGDSLSTTSEQIGPFYMQSGKKRRISNLDLYFKLKTKTRKYGADILDQDFLVFLSQAALNGIPNGPDITNVNDIYIDSLEINIYPQTLDEYNSQDLSTLGYSLGVETQIPTRG